MRPEIEDRMIAIADHCLCRRLNFKGLFLTWLFTKNSPLLSSSMILLLDLAGRLFFIIDELAAGRRQHVPPERRRRRIHWRWCVVVAASIWRERILSTKKCSRHYRIACPSLAEMCVVFSIFLGGNLLSTRLSNIFWTFCVPAEDAALCVSFLM